MFDLLIEGFASLRFGCTMALAFVGVAPVLGARRWMPVAAGAFWLAAGLSGWARFADMFAAPPRSLGLVVLGLSLVVVAVAAARLPSLASTALGAAWAGIVGGWLWVPCVGTHLSDPLNDAATDAAGTVVPILSYVLGVSLPLFAIAAVPLAVPSLVATRDSVRLTAIAVAVATVLGVVIAFGWYSDFVARFTGG